MFTPGRGSLLIGLNFPQTPTRISDTVYLLHRERQAYLLPLSSFAKNCLVHGIFCQAHTSVNQVTPPPAFPTAIPKTISLKPPVCGISMQYTLARNLQGPMNTLIRALNSPWSVLEFGL